ncbi:MAG: M48 family metallopeptidase [Dysgonamonadaceae bacterium]|jgi:predicted metal-dependent hydrolase|nr:M48 family metallopeptidase [Dysgonamonadaceae bacterium]
MANPCNKLFDPMLGDIFFRKNIRARKYIIRIKTEAITVTIPNRGSYKEAESFFRKNRDLIIKKKEEIRTKSESFSREKNVQYNEPELRKQAQAILPDELARLAKKHGFHYNSVKIRKSKTRWGSCSSKKVINLSLFLALLPAHLIEYVLLHELCHTVQMNHSPAFWNLLNSCTDGKSKELRKELKNYHI